jgi:predicted MFS family arabinose efflux permease
MLPITVAVAVRVPEGKALALGIVGTGSSMGALVLAPVVQALVDAFGWRGAYLVLGAAVVLVPLPCLLFALPRGRLRAPAAAGARSTADSAPGARPARLADDLRRPGVAALAGLLVLPGLEGFGVNVHLVPLLADLGHAPGLAAGALGAAIGVSALGKLGGGLLGDRLGALATVRLALALKLLAVAVLPLAAAPAVVGVFVVAHGLATGAQIAVLPVIALAILGNERFATLFGLLQLAATAAVGLAPLVPGLVVDATGSYAGAIGFWAAALLLALGVALRMRDPHPARAPEALAPAPRPAP